MTTVNTSDLKSAIKLLASGVGTDQALEGADSFLFSGGFAHAYNGYLGISVPIKDVAEKPVELQGCVKAKQFATWVSKLDGDDTDFAILPNGTWEITCGSDQLAPTKFTDSLTAHFEAMNLKDVKWVDLPADFHGLLSLVSMENEKSSAPFVLFDGATAMACDGVRWNLVDFPAEVGNFALSTNHVKAILSTSDLRQIAENGKWVHFLTESGVVWTAEKRDGSMYRKDIHRKILSFVEASLAANDPRNVATDLPEKLGTTVAKLGAYASKDQVSKLVPVNVKITSTNLDLATMRQEGKARSSLKWPVALPEGVDIDFAVSGPFLKEAGARGLRLHVVYIDGKDKQGNDKTSMQMAFKGTGFIQVVKMIARV